MKRTYIAMLIQALERRPKGVSIFSAGIIYTRRPEFQEREEATVAISVVHEGVSCRL